MTRSRLVLLVVWGLLAAVSVTQFIRSTADDGPDADEAAAQPPAALADTGGAGGAGTTTGDPTDRPEPVEPVLTEDPTDWPEARLLRPATPAVIATVRGDGVASRPEIGTGAVSHWFPNPTQFGGARTFLVVDDTSSDTHVKVSLPVMPNGQEGWIPRDEVDLSLVEHRAEVDLSDATVTVWAGDELVVTTRAVTGRPSAPTPVGRFYVRDIIAQPDPAGGYGPFILALSGFSEVLETFEGGLPALALHGTDRPDQIGSALSSGCLRVPNDIITTLAETVPLGTPVTIVA